MMFVKLTTIIRGIAMKGNCKEYTSICFVPKTIKSDLEPWIRFGSTKAEYKKWIPEICGICCLKMVGDTFNKTNDLSLHQLTLLTLNNGGFKILKNGTIQGVFHYPLVKLAQKFGLGGLVLAHLNDTAIIENLKNNKLILLSVDLHKLDSSITGSHLVLVHGYNHEKDEFVLHDCASVLNENGENIVIPREQLNKISNQKGITMWGR